MLMKFLHPSYFRLRAVVIGQIPFCAIPLGPPRVLAPTTWKLHRGLYPQEIPESAAERNLLQIYSYKIDESSKVHPPHLNTGDLLEVRCAEPFELAFAQYYAAEPPN